MQTLAQVEQTQVDAGNESLTGKLVQDKCEWMRKCKALGDE